jgi:hypothetical protein
VKLCVATGLAPTNIAAPYMAPVVEIPPPLGNVSAPVVVLVAAVVDVLENVLVVVNGPESASALRVPTDVTAGRLELTVTTFVAERVRPPLKVDMGSNAAVLHACVATAFAPTKSDPAYTAPVVEIPPPLGKVSAPVVVLVAGVVDVLENVLFDVSGPLNVSPLIEMVGFKDNVPFVRVRLLPIVVNGS